MGEGERKGHYRQRFAAFALSENGSADSARLKAELEALERLWELTGDQVKRWRRSSITSAGRGLGIFRKGTRKKQGD